MNKNMFAVLYVICSTLINICMSVLVIAALMLLTFGAYNVLGINQETAPLAIMGCFIVGMIVSFALFNKLNKKLAGKLDAVFRKEPKEEKEQIQTKLPDSVLDDEE